MIDRRALGSRLGLVAALALVAGLSLLTHPRSAIAAACGSDPAADAALADVIADARAACSCEGTTRGAHRRCVRDLANAAVRAGELPSRCRSSVVRFASRSTCGAREGAVTCCATTASGRDTCGIARSAAACAASRGGTGDVGATESCHDACVPVPTSTPTPSITPTPTPTGLGPRCICNCTPPYPQSCQAPHPCAVMSFVPDEPAECDVFDQEGRSCFYTVNFSAPIFYPCGF